MTSKLSPEAMELRRRYLREWRRQHREKVRDYNRTYWERQAEKRRADQDAQDQTD